MSELSLIIFTLTIQAAAGLILWMTVLRLKGQQEIAFVKSATITAIVLTAVGMFASVFHLGKPFMAVNSLTRIFNSSLSQEILLCGGFFGLLIVAYFLERSSQTSGGLKTTWGAITSLVGLVAVFMMAKVYMSTMFPVWQSWNTVVDFFAAALILGAMLFIIVSMGTAASKAIRMDLIMLAVVLVQMALVPSFMASLGAASGAGQQSAAMLTGQYGLAFAFRWLLTLGGIFAIVFLRSGKSADQASYVYAASAVLLLGVFIGRYLFYATGVAMNIGLV